jgi:hypothetical protein
MTLRSCLVLALIAGVVGAFIGRALPRDAPSTQPTPSASSASSAAEPAGRRCQTERAELASTKAHLAICMAFGTRAPETEPSGVPEAPEPSPPELEPTDPQRMSSAEEIQHNRKLLDSYSEAVIVQHYDGRTGVYKPDEWPIDGDGYIVARKLPSGELGWYAGPDAGPRSDPAAFRPSNPPNTPLPTMRREADGTITIGGKPASPGVQFMFGGKTDEPAKPQQGDAP